MFTKGLTQDVLEELKNMTRRFAKKVLVEDEDEHLVWNGEFEKPRYKVGEIVAVAQCYKDFRWPAPQRSGFQEILHSAGWSNKMYVRAELMPHQIKITGRHAELLQDISDEDCLREGISFVNGRFYIGYRKTTGQRIWLDGDTPREAFAYLIDKVSGKGTWDSNPWVYAYEFEKVR